MLNKLELIAVICIGTAVSAVGQQMDVDHFRFIQHLESIQAYDEQRMFLDEYESVYGSSDTIQLFKGRYAYFQKAYDKSISFFKGVSDSNLDYWNQAQFYAGWQSAKLGDYPGAAGFYRAVKAKDEALTNLKYLQLAGLSLLQNDLQGYQSIANRLSSSGFQHQKQLEALEFVHNRQKNRKRKSPMLAGVLSAMVPGAGKFYLGQVGQGTMGLVATAIMGAQTYEGYRKDGVKSARFIVFGSLFSILYIANIWGSVVAVRVENIHFNQENHETILLHMHIPVRLRYR